MSSFCLFSSFNVEIYNFKFKGIAADVGTLQRLPKAVGNDSVVRELAYTARKFHSDEAKSIGFIGRIFPDRKMFVLLIQILI